jgi:signal peptidase I
MVFAPTLTGLERMLLPIDPVKRGDILVFKFPEDPTRDFIKRVIGLPGDTVELKGKTVHINGKPLEEPYVRFLFPDDLPSGVGLAGTDPRRKYGPVTVPADMFFMMGDNRDNSEDSRLLGLHAALVHQGEGAVRVFFVRRRQRPERSALEHPLEPDVSSDSLIDEDGHQAHHRGCDGQRGLPGRVGVLEVLPVQGRDAADDPVRPSRNRDRRSASQIASTRRLKRDVPLDGDGVDVNREGMRTVAEVSYTEKIELFPRYFYPMDFSFSAEAYGVAGASPVKTPR